MFLLLIFFAGLKDLPPGGEKKKEKAASRLSPLFAVNATKHNAAPASSTEKVKGRSPERVEKPTEWSRRTDPSNLRRQLQSLPTPSGAERTGAY